MVLNKLFPVIIVDDQQIHFVHPIILGLIKEWKLENNLVKEDIARLLRLLNVANSQSRWISVYTHPDTEYFSAKINLKKDIVVRKVKRVTRLIKIAKQITAILSVRLT
jgi:hypothetical protein